MDYRKLILIIGFVVVTVLLGIGVYWVFFKWVPGEEPAAVNVPVDGGQLPGIGEGPDTAIGGAGDGTLPGVEDRDGVLPVDETETPDGVPQVSDIAEGGVTRTLPLTTDIVQDPVIQPGGQGLAYYNPLEGKFYRLSHDGKMKSLLSDETYYAVESVTWSRDTAKAVLEYPDGSNVVYDFTTKQQVTLPQQAQDFTFSPDSGEIAYEYIGGGDGKNWLTVSKTDGTGAEFVQALGDRADQVQVSWSPTRAVVALYRNTVGIGEEEIIFLGLNQENFKSVVVSGIRFQGVWSPRGDRIVYHIVSAATEYRPALWTMQAVGDTIGRNHFPLSVQTWVDKCAFSNDGKALYCAVPREMPRGAGFDRSIVGSGVPDDIYYIDIASGQSRLLAQLVPEESNGVIQVASLFVNPTEDTLFIWDAVSKSMFQMRLK